jgi:hypothetical protein
MTGITPPFLELHFYFATMSETDALWCMVESALSLGAISNLTRDELFDYVVHSNADNVAINMGCLSGTLHKSFGLLTYGSISEEAARYGYQRPIAIWTSADTFSGLPDYLDEKLMQQEGRRIYKRFCAFIEYTQPSYASITCENDLGCPYDLRRAPNPDAFRTFFVSEAYAGRVRLEKLHTMFAGAHIEQVHDGLYISCDPYFSPKRRLSMQQSPWQVGREASKLVGEACS